MSKIKLGLVMLVGLIISVVLVGQVKAIFPPGFDKVSRPDKEAVSENNPKFEGVRTFVQDEIIVKFKGDAEPFRVIKVPEGKVGEKIKEYLKRADVEYAEPNYIAYALMVPNDPYYKYQWHFDNPVYGGIQMEEAWDVSTGAASVVVAVVDTGIAYENYGVYKQAPDLVNTCFKPGYDFINNDSHPNDDNSHGTHVAGTVAQSTNNGVGVAGVAFNTCLMPVKVLNRSGSGTYTQVANGIYWAVDHGAQVINLSLGGNSSSATLENAVADAYNHGVTVIAAAGNDSSSTISYPAAYNAYVIAVGATRYDETLSYYSNYGSSLDFVAPGGDLNVDQNGDIYGDGVLQNTFNPNTKNPSDFGYWFFQGTSMAAPHVSGAAALLIAKGNATTPDQIRTAFRESAECLPRGGTCPNNTYGYGLVDAYQALQWKAAPVIACYADTDCNDSNFCTTDLCLNPGTLDAYCQNTAIAGGTTCDDGKFCTVNDVCTAGLCGGIVRDCSDGVACTVDSCDEVNDVCLNNSSDSYCNDGLYCNGAEYCDSILGCQLGTPINCDDGNECTMDTCDENKNACQYTKVADNIPCTNGVCCSGTCTIGITECPTAVMCWSGSNQFLYQNNGQAKKFCKCAQGTYGYKSYSYSFGRKTVYQYVDTGNNENWKVTSRSSNLPIYRVICTDGKAYFTNQDYWYSK